MSQQGITLLELMIVTLLIPIVGLTVVQIDFLIRNQFQRITRNMISEQGVEITLGAIARDLINAREIIVFSDGGAWATAVPVGTPGDGIELSVDDDNFGLGRTPLETADDDHIRYWLNGNDIFREYAIDDSGIFDAGQAIARNIGTLEFTQTTEQPTVPENLPTPRNVVRVMVSATVGQATVTRTRYITSRSLQALQP